MVKQAVIFADVGELKVETYSKDPEPAEGGKNLIHVRWTRANRYS